MIICNECGCVLQPGDKYYNITNDNIVCDYCIDDWLSRREDKVPGDPPDIPYKPPAHTTIVKEEDLKL